ncbi:MAG: hypothetical protein IT369_23780 [Candidatus Latescibacteria bacterium]|nr:hypothetical protein [Candidatus Latescibacterota bacterium]
MENWISYLLLALGASLGLVVGYLLRQRRAERLRLRLVAGQSHLLSAQLAQRLADLEQLEQEPLDELREEASGALDELHVLLIERQAHLQNCEDLVHLQQQKIAWLAKAPKPAAPARPARTTTPRETKSPAATAPPPRRDHLEDQLLQQIDELNRKRRNPPPPPKK